MINKEIERLHEKKIMNNGKLAEIITYRNANDIDVQFENGVISKNKTYIMFSKGYISDKPKNRNKKIGETKLMNCGMKATIINYKNCQNIDVKFEDGTVVSNRSYGSFKNGRILNPKLATSKCRIDRVGETRTMNCGLSAKIIDYRATDDIDVMFEDGAVIRNTRYQQFKLGKISKNELRSKLHEKRIMSNGMEAEIIAYRNCKDIDVKFSNGTIVSHKRYNNFLKGKIFLSKQSSGPRKIDRMNEIKKMSCGMEAKIIKYNSSMDIDVMFEDGMISRNKTYQAFLRGWIAHPKKEFKTAH